MKCELRKNPYPYHSMLAICSDLDETPGGAEYFEISRFLNTDESTRMGRGVSLEVGNTVYFDMPADQFSYWGASAVERDRLHGLIRSGHVDCFHSFGDQAVRREQVARSLAALDEHNCRIGVWVDHAQARSNFGADIMQGRGDLLSDPVYHADLTVSHGVRYVWLGRVTSLIGQDTRYRPVDMLNVEQISASMKSSAKDLIKKTLGTVGNRKYGFHSRNTLLRDVKLRDGQGVQEFMRCNPHPDGVSGGDNSVGIAEVLTSRYLDRLVRCNGASIIYTHLGKRLNKATLFSAPTIEAFHRLSDYCSGKMVLVTTTRRLLDYCSARRQADIRYTPQQGETRVDIRLPGELPADGLTFYWDAVLPAVYVNGARHAAIEANPPDKSGRASVSVCWPGLEWAG